ncbi:MAG: GNAT family N-acetyltransferase [Clostridia bacterium]|nr:GNAT family N-acetyltransferase [Clostridia bacterium]
MKIETERLIIRDLERKDQPDIARIVWQESVMKFMRDWSENIPDAESLNGYVDWHQSQKESTDVYQAKRYAITLKGEDKFIGSVGMGLEDTVNEVEIAYFLDEDYQGHGYATEAVNALFDRCMQVSDLDYMVLLIDVANDASNKVAERTGFELFERRTPISHKQNNMVSESYNYWRKYRDGNKQS